MICNNMSTSEILSLVKMEACPNRRKVLAVQDVTVPTFLLAQGCTILTGAVTIFNLVVVALLSVSTALRRRNYL